MQVKVLVISNYRETLSTRPEAEMFIGLQQAGVEVEVMTYGDAPYVETFRKAGIRVIDFHPDKKFSFDYIKKIRQELKRGGHHILHMFNSRAIVNGLQAARGLPVKVVLYRGFAGHVHWYDPTAYFKFLSPGADSIICVSENVKEDLESQMVFGGKEKLIVIPKGHSPAWYNQVTAVNIRQQLGLPKDSFLTINVANNRPMKGIPYLVKAMHLLPEESPIHLLLIGNGMDSPELMSLMQEGRNTDKIHVLGFRENPLETVAACDVFVLSSTHGEGLSKVVVEAMSLGIPPVVTTISSNKGLVVDQESGLKVAPADPQALADAILKLYKNSSLRKKLGQAAKKHIETNFHIRTSVERTKKLYEKLRKK